MARLLIGCLSQFRRVLLSRFSELFFTPPVPIDSADFPVARAGTPTAPTGRLRKGQASATSRWNSQGPLPIKQDGALAIDRPFDLAALLALDGEDVFADEGPHGHVRVALVQLAHAVQRLELDHARALHHLGTLCKHGDSKVQLDWCGF